MAYDFVAASSQYIEGGAAAVTDEPVTFSALVYPKSPTANGIVMSIGTASATDRWQLNHASGQVQAWTVTTVTSATANAASTYTNDVWSQFGGIVSTDSSRQAFLNGVGGTANTTTLAIAQTLARTVIGARMAISYGTFASARIAEVAVWNVALTGAEMASLSKGFKPTRIRPQSLKFYAPLLRNLQDLQTAMSLTNNNTATVVNHPRVY
jgi:hypothetical protein